MARGLRLLGAVLLGTIVTACASDKGVRQPAAADRSNRFAGIPIGTLRLDAKGAPCGQKIRLVEKAYWSVGTWESACARRSRRREKRWLACGNYMAGGDFREDRIDNGIVVERG